MAPDRTLGVLVLSNMYPPHHLGGYELSCRDVVDRLRARGHRCTVLTSTMRVPGVESPEGESEAGVRRELTAWFRDGDVWRAPLWRRPLIERANQRALARALDEARPDVVFVWHMGALSLGLLTTLVRRRVPLVYAVCDDWLCYGVALDCWIRLWANRPRAGRVASALAGVPTRLPDLGRSGAFCFVSESTRARAESGSPWSFPVATVVYSGVDRTDFPAPASAPGRAWAWRLLFVGRLDQRKGADTAVRSLARLPEEATLGVVGRGTSGDRDRLVSLVRELGLESRVTFAEADRAGVRAHYERADVVLFPSEWEEPFGLVPVEAMASGRPVVATALGGSAEFLVDGVNCVEVPPRDPAAVARAVGRLAADPALRAALVEGGWRTAEALDVDRLAEVFETWLRSAAEHHAGGTPAMRPPPVAGAGARGAGRAP